MDEDIIKQPQRNVKEPMINRNLIFNIISSAFIIIAGTLFVFYKEVCYVIILILSFFLNLDVS